MRITALKEQSNIPFIIVKSLRQPSSKTTPPKA